MNSLANFVVPSFHDFRWAMRIHYRCFPVRVYVRCTFARVRYMLAYMQLRIFMRSSTCAYARVRLRCVLVRVHAAFMPFVLCLGTNGLETKTCGLKKRERNKETEKEKEKSRRRGKRKEEKKEKKKKKTKRSNDRLVARIGFRTVSNDTGQDTTAIAMVPGIPSAITNIFFSVYANVSFSLGIGLLRRLAQVTGHTRMKRAS